MIETSTGLPHADVAGVRELASRIGADFVFPRKSNPAMVAMDEWVSAIAEQDFSDVLAVTRANNCAVEITVKNISTCRHQPRRLCDWCDIAARMVRA